MNKDRLDKLKEGLYYHKPSLDVQAMIEQIRLAGIEYIEKVGLIVGDNRDAALWATHFEDAQQRAIRSVVVPQ